MLAKGISRRESKKTGISCSFEGEFIEVFSSFTFRIKMESTSTSGPITSSVFLIELWDSCPAKCLLCSRPNTLCRLVTMQTKSEVAYQQTKHSNRSGLDTHLRRKPNRVGPCANLYTIFYCIKALYESLSHEDGVAFYYSERSCSAKP